MNDIKCVITIVYKVPLANGDKSIYIDMDIDKQTVYENFKTIDDTSRFITILDIHETRFYIPTDNIGKIEVAE